MMSGRQGKLRKSKAPCYIMPHTIYHTLPLTSRAGIMLKKKKKKKKSREITRYLQAFIILFIEMYILHKISTIVLYCTSSFITLSKRKTMPGEKKRFGLTGIRTPGLPPHTACPFSFRTVVLSSRHPTTRPPSHFYVCLYF